MRTSTPSVGELAEALAEYAPQLERGERPVLAAGGVGADAKAWSMRNAGTLVLGGAILLAGLGTVLAIYSYSRIDRDDN